MSNAVIRDITIAPPCAIELFDDGASVRLHDSDPKHLCLELALLVFGCSHFLRIFDAASTRTIVIGAGISEERTVGMLEASQFSLHPTSHDLQRLLHFLLAYFRDGIAPMSEFDLEVVNPESEDSLTFVLEFSKSRPPVSPADFHDFLNRDE